MPYIQTMDRNQMVMCSLDSYVDQESIARVIDIFVEGLNLDELGFEKAEAAAEGRPSYSPGSLLKLYLYGNQKAIRSSRRLAEACRINVEAKWLMEGLEPDFRTISDFRKVNVECMKKVFHEFNRKLSEVLKKGFVSVDGSKFQANNSKDRNFTANKLDDRIQWLNEHTDEYLRQMAELDDTEGGEITGQFSKDELEKRLKETTERLERYKAYQSYMKENGVSQISLTDADAKLMKGKTGFVVAYNVQTAIDSETHLIDDYQVTNQPTDHGLINSTVSDERIRRDEVLEVVADKGYNEQEDMVKCLENGIIPHVILPNDQDEYKLELPYEDKTISEEMLKSTSADDLKECLRAGEIPEIYKEAVESAKVVDKKVFIQEVTANPTHLYENEDEMKRRAQEGYFVRDPEQNLVYCPAGEILRQKSIKKNGNIRYANKTACRHCEYKNQCYKGKSEYKEIDFDKDTLEKPNRNWLKQEEGAEIPKRTSKKGYYEDKKVVEIVLRPDRQKMSERKSLSEHPFGTIKRAMNAGYYLLCGKHKVDGETALICLAYNLKRAMSLLGFQKMMNIMA